MSWFTPIVKFDFQHPKKWKKISKLTIKKISEDQLLRFFGISQRKLDDMGRVISYTYIGTTPEISILHQMNLAILNELQKYDLYSCKYAFVSDLNEDDHINEVEQILTALRLFCLNGITCPVTFNDKSPGVRYIYPLTSQFDRKVFTDSEFKKISQIKSNLSRLDPEDLKMLSIVIEQGYSMISFLLLMTILERNIMKGDRNEISFKVRIFTAKLLSKFFHYKEKEVFNNVKNFYTYRSKFVHEGKALNSNELKNILPILYEYVIKILLIKINHPSILNPDKRNELLWKR